MGESPLLEFVDFEFHLLQWYEYLVYGFMAVFCIVFAGLMSGLTLGLLSFEPMTLEILAQTGKPKERKRAKKISKLVRHHHWLLCTLLISNALAMEALPIFLDSLVPATVAILISVSCILLFGEVIPQALCSRYGLLIGSFSFYLVAFLMIITFPISFPLAKLLDCILGKTHLTFYRRDQLQELVALHGTGSSYETNPLSKDEITVIRGALEMSQKTVRLIMTKLENVFMLSVDSVLNLEILKEIQTKGHSRIPIYEKERRNMVGLLLVKTLITINPDDCIPLRNLEYQNFPIVEEDMNVWDMLNIFQEGKSHMALVVSCTENRKKRIKKVIQESNSSSDSSSSTDGDEKSDDSNTIKVDHDHNPASIYLPSPEAKIFNNFQEFKLFKAHYENRHHGGEVLGVVTLEDVIEELIQEEIIDETDVFVDLNTRMRVADAARRISLSASASKKRILSKTKSELERILDERVEEAQNTGLVRSKEIELKDIDNRDVTSEIIEIREKKKKLVIPPIKEILIKKKSVDKELLIKKKMKK